ncbi:MAG: type II 3-dehydroquinate dehydratase [Clostridiales bacterium]|nr:type II 3-dehydroquinate dehydratase [Clostridiales bacterium]
MGEKKYYLLGGTLGHSHSPRVHAALGNPAYALHPLPSEALADFFAARDFAGVNVTIPYKQAVMPLCDALDAAAVEIGAVNTVVNCGGKLFGCNTDIDGFLFLCREAKISLAGKKVLVLGSGGTSHTVCAAAKRSGAREVVVVSRTGDVNYGNVHALCGDAEILVNTTPVGMYPHGGESPLSLDGFDRLTGVVDVVYNPLRTALLLDAERRGIPAAGGLSMLVAQAAAADTLFRGRRHTDGEIGRIAADLRRELKNIVLIGMPGCGKSTVGKCLAAKTGRELIDLDTAITARAGMKIPDIFEKFGEAHFRDLETEVTKEVCATGGKIIACGGGTVLREENRAALSSNGYVVYLRRAVSKLARGGRPLSAGDGAVERLYKERRAVYEAAADCILPDTDGVQVVAARALAAFRKSGGKPAKPGKEKRMKLLVLNGPNINMLGIREPGVYGKETYAALLEKIRSHCAEKHVEVKCFQSNHEGALVDEIQAAYGKFDGIVINPAAYTHTSVAILDALKAVSIPTVEVHISDVNTREEFRHFSYVSLAAKKTIVGHGTDGYLEAVDWLCEQK